MPGGDKVCARTGSIEEPGRSHVVPADDGATDLWVLCSSLWDRFATVVTSS